MAETQNGMSPAQRLERRREYAKLVKKLGSPDPRDRLEARRAIRSMDESVPPLKEADELRMEGVEPNVPRYARPVEKGVSRYDVRSAMSKGDTTAEKVANIEKIAGPGTVSVDPETDRLVLSVEGRRKLGDEGATEPTFIDPEGADFQDFVGDARGIIAPVVGGVAAAMATRGVSLLPGMASAAAGSGFGKMIDELAEAMTGDQKQSASQIAGDVIQEGITGAVGEAGGRAIGWVGRKATGPNKGAVREGGAQILRDAEDIGIVVRAPNLVNGMTNNIIRKLQGVTDAIFGDVNAYRNSVAINEEVARLRTRFNAQIDSATDIAELARADIKEGREALREKYNAKFGLVDSILGDRQIVDTGAIKEQAIALFDNLPTKTVRKNVDTGVVDANGKKITRIAEEQIPIIDRPELVQALSELSDFQSLGQLQNLRTVLKEEIDFGTLNKTVNERQVSLLLKSIDEAFERTEAELGKNAAAGNAQAALYKQALEQLQAARNGYSKDIKVYDDALIEQVAKDPNLAVSPFKLMNLVMAPGNEAAAKKILSAVKPETASKISSLAMNRILDRVVKLTGDAVTDKGGKGGVFDGTALLGEINRLGGRDADGGVVTALLGPDVVGELRRLGTSIQAATRQKGDKSGALVAAAIAVRPFDNLGKIAKLAVIGKILRSPQGVRWLTEGYVNPESKAGKFALDALSATVRYYAQEEARGDTSVAPDSEEEK